MKFKRNKKLIKRIENLEEYLGIFYHVDTDGWVNHKLEQDGYGVIQKLKRDIKDLKKEQKGKKKCTDAYGQGWDHRYSEDTKRGVFCYGPNKEERPVK